MKDDAISKPLTSSKIIVLVAKPILTDGGPPAWAVDKRAELGWPSSRGKGWLAVCKSGPRLCSFTVLNATAHEYGTRRYIQTAFQPQVLVWGLRTTHASISTKVLGKTRSQKQRFDKLQTRADMPLQFLGTSFNRP